MKYRYHARYCNALLYRSLSDVRFSGYQSPVRGCVKRVNDVMCEYRIQTAFLDGLIKFLKCNVTANALHIFERDVCKNNWHSCPFITVIIAL
jgi:hypothetical protein